MNDIENISQINDLNDIKTVGKISDLEKALNSKTFKEFQRLSEKLFLEKKLKDNDFNILRTANEIEIQRSHVYNKIESLEIVIPGRINSI